MDKQQLKQELIDICVIQRGQFTLKSGEVSPVYIDLRRVISYPRLLRAMANAMWACAIDHIPSNRKPQRICGVPYGAVPVATCIAIDQALPLILCRKEQKLHGGKNRIEGVFESGQSCIVVEDVITSGGSLLETIQEIEAAGLVVTDAIVFVDREHTGASVLKRQGIHLHRVFTLSDLARSPVLHSIE